MWKYTRFITIRLNGITINTPAESINGQPGKYELAGFILTLEYDDGYSQFCGLRLSEL
jgi:hypothetical protein